MSTDAMNDWGYILRGFRFGFVRGAVSVIFITTILIWILEATEHDSPFRTVPGGRHRASHQHTHTRGAAQTPRAESVSVEFIYPDGSSANAGNEAAKAATTVGIQKRSGPRRTTASGSDASKQS
jgi:hypothetical protein